MADRLRFLPFLTVILWAAAPLPCTSKETLHAIVHQWLVNQTNVVSWTANFQQTRVLKSLKQPLHAHGKIWFTAPNRFRWEIQRPSETLVVRTPDALKIFYPRLKRVEVYSLDGTLKGSWKHALDLLEAGFPRSEADLLSQYTVESQSQTPADFKLVLRPRSSAARKLIQTVSIRFSMQTFDLLSTELELADGSRMINDFSEPVRNPTIPPEIFSPTVPGDFKVSKPLARQ